MPPSPPVQQAGTTAPAECPRCHSLDTKFCYYNNYNLSQPRHFCKSCRRYWTLGGSLRDVPVGGATRRRAQPSPRSAPAKRAKKAPPETEEPPALAGDVAEDPLGFLDEVGCFGLDLGLGVAAMEDLGFGAGKVGWSFPSDEIGGGGAGVEMWPLDDDHGGGDEVAAARELAEREEGVQRQ